MKPLIPVLSQDDILPQYRSTPIARLLEYHNLDVPFQTYSRAEMLIGMCMDNRKHLRIPDNFSYIIRAGGANLRNSEFKVSYAIAVGGAKAIALIAHNNCGMVNLASRKDLFIENLVINAGWTHEHAEDHFNSYAPLFEIGNEIEFVVSEAERLRRRYPKILVCPMLYRVEDNLLYLIDEG
jgi:carbonic anhydrase